MPRHSLPARAALLAALVATTACSTMAPRYERPAAPVPPSWPVGDAYLRQSERPLATFTYRDVFRDPRLQTLIDQALANNRDLKLAVANIAQARATYRIQRADLFPQINATAGYTYRYSGGTNVGTTTGTGVGAGNGTGGTGTGGTGTGGTGTGSGGTGTGGTGTGGVGNGNAGGGTGFVTGGSGSTSIFQLGVGASAYELDLFGRVRSLTNSALASYFAQEAAARATRLTLVADLAEAWLTYASDRSLLKVAQDTAASAQRSVQLTDARLKGGIAPRTDLRQAQQVLFTAQADLAQQTSLLAQDRNALRLLVGAEVDPALLPASIEEASANIADVPAGLDSSILLRRPDVVQAEYQLRAANAEIGAARAELFPRIVLTALAGLASTALGSLFSGDAFTFTASPNASYPIFRAGAGRATVQQSEAARDAALASYERAIQEAFRDVANGLAVRGTIDARLTATTNFYDAALDTYRLATARYRGGVDTFLASLDAQRSLYSAQQQLVAIRLARANSLVTLYRSLGGDNLLEVAPTGAVPPPVELVPAARSGDVAAPAAQQRVQQ